MSYLALARLPALPLALAALSTPGCGADLTLPADGTPTAIVAVSGDAQQGVPGARLPNPLVVEVRDAQGRPVPGVRIAFRFAHVATGASVTPGSVATGADGRAATRAVLPQRTGDQVVEALLTGDNLPSLSTSFILTARAASGGGSGAGAPAGDQGGGTAAPDGGGNGGGNGGGREPGRGHEGHGKK